MNHPGMCFADPKKQKHADRASNGQADPVYMLYSVRQVYESVWLFSFCLTWATSVEI